MLYRLLIESRERCARACMSAVFLNLRQVFSLFCCCRLVVVGDFQKWWAGVLVPAAAVKDPNDI